MTPPTIVIDSREQHPYAFDPALCTALVKRLDAADYSLLGLEERVAVERKSLNDLVGTLAETTRRTRFFDEMRRLETRSHVCLVVEGSLADIQAGRRVSAAASAGILGTLLTLMTDYHVPVMLAGDRPQAAAFTQAFLLRAHAALLARPHRPDPRHVRALQELVALRRLAPGLSDYDDLLTIHARMNGSREVALRWGRILRSGIRHEWLELETAPESDDRRELRLGRLAPELAQLPEPIVEAARAALWLNSNTEEKPCTNE